MQISLLSTFAARDIDEGTHERLLVAFIAVARAGFAQDVHVYADTLTIGLKYSGAAPTVFSSLVSISGHLILK